MADAKAPEPAPASAAAEFTGVSFRWPGADGFSLRVERFVLGRGERVLLLGPSGSGKSTLLSLLCGILLPQEGSVTVLATDLKRLSGPARDRYRADHIGIIFQMFNLLPYGSVLDNVLLPLRFAAARRARAGAADGGRTEAARLLERLGLQADLWQRRSAATLSVGQQQRVAVARALIGAPEIVIADEPTSALDRDRQIAFLDLLAAEVSRAGSSLLMVSHDEGLAPRFDRVVPLADLTSGGDRG